MLAPQTSLPALSQARMEHQVQISPFGQLVLDRGQLPAQRGVRGKPPVKASSRFTGHGIAQTASQPAQVGLERPCLHPAAVGLLASASSGLPRLLRLLARAAWLAAAQANLNTIGPEHLQAALELVPAARDRLNP